MGKRRRGRDRLESCESCGRSIPRDKAVSYNRRSVFSTDMRGSDENVFLMSERSIYYCISCAKHRHIFEKKKEQARKRREW